MLKGIIPEENLPKNHWEAAARAAEFLLDRSPTVAKSRASRKDCDCIRPTEGRSIKKSHTMCKLES